MLTALKGVVESFRLAKMNRLKKYWQDRVVQFQIVHRTSTNSAALAYAHFHFLMTHGKSPKEVSELTEAARRCGEALRGEEGAVRIPRLRIPRLKKGGETKK